MRSSFLALLLAGACLLGCSGPSVTPEQAPPPRTVNQEVELYERFRTGLFSIDAAVAHLEEALTQSRAIAPKAGGDAKEAFLDVADLVDSAGATLADVNEAPPSKEEFTANFKTYDEARLKAIDSTVDAYRDTQAALGILADLLANVPADLKDQVVRLEAEVSEAADAAEEAIKSMGGQLPAEEEAPDPATPAP